MFGDRGEASGLRLTWTVTWLHVEQVQGRCEAGSRATYKEGRGVVSGWVWHAGEGADGPSPLARGTGWVVPTLREGNAGRSESVGGEHEGGLGWLSLANSVGCLLGFLRPAPHRRLSHCLPHDLLPSSTAGCCADLDSQAQGNGTAWTRACHSVPHS